MKYLQPAVGIEKIFSSATHVRVLSLFSANTTGAIVCERDGGKTHEEQRFRSESDPSAPGCHSSTDPRAARFAQRRLRQPLSSSTLLTRSDKHAEVTRDARGCGTMTACCVTLYVHLYCV